MKETHMKDGFTRFAQSRWSKFAVAAVIVGGFAAGYWYRDQQKSAAPLFTASVSADTPGIPEGGFVQLVKKAQPAVVNVFATTEVKPVRGQRQMPQDFFQFFGNPFGGEAPDPQGGKRQGLGSGVIMSSDGFVLTNNHVVEGATEIKVSLTDRREFTAKVVGADKQTDVAVLKIEAKDLPIMPVGNSDRLQVGELALAIGNPFGVGQTVTMGIVSGKGRNSIGDTEYEDFIQTDAAINPGNSGGALVNTRGELIGINTAILSRSGGNAGIGFAIPVNMARDVMTQLVKSGKVTRGFLGITMQPLDKTLAKANGLPENAGGVIVTKVDPSGPAGKAGLKQGDIIRGIDGTPVQDNMDLRLRVARSMPGTTIKLDLYRDGKSSEVPVTLVARNEAAEKNLLGSVRGGDSKMEGTGALSGVSVDNLTPNLMRQLQLPAEVQGVVVSDLDESSLAFDSGLRQGDVIQKINGTVVRTVADFDRVVGGLKGKTLVLLVNRGGNIVYVGIEPK